MKDLFRIIRRYSMSAGLIVFVILFCNFACLWYLLYVNMENTSSGMHIRNTMEQIGEELFTEEDREEGQEMKEYELSRKGLTLLEESEFIWGMALDREGNIAWNWRLPAELVRNYELRDVASFTRWYLEDYPVRTWSYGELLLVFGSPKHQVGKYHLEFPEKVLGNFFFYIKLILLINILVVALFVICFGYRFYCSLKPVAEGIDKISRQERVHLKEKGMSGDLAKKLNQTSEILEKQRRCLEQRDQARTDWISGVSHDIRTPLALIMGYTDQLSENRGISQDTSEKGGSIVSEQDIGKIAAAIRRQSLIIRQLIRDLNLTSKLAYGVEPLQKKKCLSSRLLRECVADLYNEGLEQNYEIEVEISEDAEQMEMFVDEELIRRALRNLIGNSIRHNPEGCRIEVVLHAGREFMEYTVLDTGAGIPEAVVQRLEFLENKDIQVLDEYESRKTTPHIMGLRLTQQIARSHDGDLMFIKRVNGTYDASIRIGRGV